MSQFANGSASGITPPAGDLGGSVTSPTVVGTHLTGTTTNALVKANAVGGLVSATVTDDGTTVTVPGGALTVGKSGTNGGVLTLPGATSGAMTLTAPAVAGTTTNALVSSNTLQVPTGNGISVAALQIAATGVGFDTTGSGTGIVALIGAAQQLFLSSTKFEIKGNVWREWNSENSAITLVNNGATPTVQIGQANAAAPVNQVVQAQGSRSGTDTNVAGANLTIASGQGTGNSAGSSLLFQAPVAVASGSGAQTMTTFATVNSSGISGAAGPLSGNWNNVNVTPVTVSANVNTDQNLMSVSVPAGTLNAVGKTLRIWCAGIYSTPAASTSVITVKIKLGAVTLINIATTALGGLQATNNQFNVLALLTTQTAGASATLECHGNLTIDLGVGNAVADTTFADTNTAVSAALDSTAANTLQVTISFSNASGSNTASHRQMIIDSVN